MRGPPLGIASSSVYQLAVKATTPPILLRRGSPQVWQRKGCSLVLAVDLVAKRNQHGWRPRRSAMVMVTRTQPAEYGARH